MSKIVATIDLSSNSFHLLISQINPNGSVVTLDYKKHKVQLRSGLTADYTIDKDTQARAIACMQDFRSLLDRYTIDLVKAVGTYTLRRAQENITEFKKTLESILGHAIEIISGDEEAHLVFLGASIANKDAHNTLVIDIGGGSTEIVLGKKGKLVFGKSLNFGCVGVQKDFFSDGLNRENFDNAIEYVKNMLDPVKDRYLDYSWDNVLGSSGTIRAIIEISKSRNTIITKNILSNLIDTMIDFSNVEDIAIPGLRDDRKNILAGGVSVLYAIFDKLSIDKMELSSGALREGVLYELVNTLKDRDDT